MTRVDEEPGPKEAYEPPFRQPAQLLHTKGTAILQDAWFNKVRVRYRQCLPVHHLCSAYRYITLTICHAAP